MAKQTINVGSGEYSGDGESIRIAFTKVNSNFTEVYTQVPLATTATYAQSFNTSTLVTSAVNATTSSFATTSGYALSFNTGTMVGTAVTATYAQSFNTSTLVRAAVSATNVVNGTWTLSLSTAGSILLNGTVFSGGAVSATTSTLVNGTSTVRLSSTGAVTFPAGGIISEGGGISGAIKLTPAGGTTSTQALLIYPTAAAGDGDHIHLTAGGGTTDLYLGNDNQYVKVDHSGTVVVGTSANTSTFNWAFDTDGFFNPASIIYLNSNAGYVERASTTGYYSSELNNGTYLRKKGLRLELYDNIDSNRKINSALINGLAHTANTATTEYTIFTALLTPTLTATNQFAVGIQIDGNNNPFAAGWDAAHPGDTNQYKFQLAYQAVYIIGGVTYQYTQQYTRTRDAPGVYTETIQEGVLPNYPPGTNTSATVIDLGLNPVSSGWTTVVNRGRAFANARGAAGVVPTQIAFQGGFSRNLSAALVYGQANTGTTSTSALVDFSGIANAGAVPESSIVGDGYISLVAGGEMYIFDKNGITLPNTMRIVSSLNGAVILGGAGWGTTGTGSVSIGDGVGQTGDYSVAIGYQAGTNSSEHSVTIGSSSGENQSTGSVAIGYYTGNQQSEFAVAIGNGAGENQSTGSVAIGSGAGNQQGIGSVAIGQAAGTIHQDQLAVAIGSSAGLIVQGAQAVAIGNLAGYAGQRNNAVAIGQYAGAGFVYAEANYVSTGSTSTTLMISITSGTIVVGMKLYQGLAFSNQTVVTVNSATQITLSAPPDSTPLVGPIGFILGQGNHSIAIGTYAGYYSSMYDAQEDNTIILNATGTPLIGVNSQTSSLYVAPIRNSAATNILYYNTTTKEITYSSTANITAVNITATNVSINTSGFLKLSAYSASNLRAITGNIGWMAAVSDSLQGSDPNGMIAFWDSTNNRWSYVHNNGAV